MIKVVITGASGFLGSNIIQKLANDSDVMVYALSSKCSDSLFSNVKMVHKDIIDCDEAKEILSDAIVVNCAFPRNSTGNGMADGLSYINRVFMACSKYQAKAIINISSQSVYSQTRDFMADEQSEICLESPYAVGKYATELMLKGICEGTQTSYTNLRLASLIGPGFDQRIVNRLVKKAVAMEPISITISDQRFGFLDIEDAVDAVTSLLHSDIRKWKSVYNVGNGKAISLKDIITNIAEVFQERKFPMPAVSYVNEEKSGSTAVSFQSLHDDAGFEPHISLKTSIIRILDHIQTTI